MVGLYITTLMGTKTIRIEVHYDGLELEFADGMEEAEGCDAHTVTTMLEAGA